MNFCPVCWQEVRETKLLNVVSHFDSLRRDVCPGSGQPYTITIEQGRAAA